MWLHSLYFDCFYAWAWTTVFYFFACLVILGWKLDNLDNILYCCHSQIWCTFLSFCWFVLATCLDLNCGIVGFPCGVWPLMALLRFLFLFLTFSLGFLGVAAVFKWPHNASTLRQWIWLWVRKSSQSCSQFSSLPWPLLFASLSWVSPGSWEIV